MKISYEQRHGHSRTRIANGSHRKDFRRIEADERQKYWDSLSVQDKIEILKKRPGNSLKQIEKLQKFL